MKFPFARLGLAELVFCFLSYPPPPRHLLTTQRKMGPVVLCEEESGRLGEGDEVRKLLAAGWLGVEEGRLVLLEAGVSGAGSLRSELSRCLQTLLGRLAFSEDDDDESVEFLLDRSSAAAGSASMGWPSVSGELSRRLFEAGLLPTLRTYQLAAVEFLLKREALRQETISPLEDGWRRVGEAWWEPRSGVVSVSEPLPRVVAAARGGVLADDMGLGKTLVAMAVIILGNEDSPEIMTTASATTTNTTMTRKKSRGSGGAAMECLCGDAQSLEAKTLCPRCARPFHLACWSDYWERCPGCEIELCDIDAAHRAKRRGHTLIVCPPSIIGQWQTEIAKHCRRGALAVHRYRGVGYSTRPAPPEAATSSSSSKKRRKKTTPLQEEEDVSPPPPLLGDSPPFPLKSTRCQRLCELSPATLMEFDVVLTTYETLRSESHHSHTALDKRYAIIRSPLLAMSWLRVIVDEAQMCESNVSAATKFAREVDARCRWAVTGTPVRRDMDQSRTKEDLLSLFVFLRAEPWLTKRRKTSSRQLKAAIGRFVWRATKEAVGPELLGIPPAHLDERRLDFTDVESVFYDETKRIVGRDVARKLAKIDMRHRRFQIQQQKRRLNKQDHEDSSDANIHHLDENNDSNNNGHDIIISAEKNNVTFLESTASEDNNGEVMNAADIEAVAQDLRKLRQACCHPSAVGGSMIGVRRKKKRRRSDDNDGTKPAAFHTLDEVLTQLCVNARLELENKHRETVFWRGALAALVDARGELEERHFGDLSAGHQHRSDAIALYESVLADIDSTRGCVEVLGDVTFLEEQTAPPIHDRDLALVASPTFAASQQKTSYYRRGTWTVCGALSKFTRIDVGDGKRLVAIACRSLSTTKPVRVEIEVAIPVLGGATLFDAVCPAFTLPPADPEKNNNKSPLVVAPIDDASCNKIQRKTSYAHPRGRQWRLVVETLDTDAAAEENKMEPLLEIRLFEAETDTDAIQELHAAYNLQRRVLRSELKEKDDTSIEANKTFLPQAWSTFLSPTNSSMTFSANNRNLLALRESRTFEAQVKARKAVHDREKLVLGETGNDATSNVTDGWWQSTAFETSDFWNGFAQSW